MTRSIWNSTLSRSIPLRSGKGPSRTTKMVKLNVGRAKKRDAEYRRKLAAYRRSETYTIVEARAGGRCEQVRWMGEPVAFPVRCGETDGLAHHHLTYARFGGQELPRDVIVLCPVHHDREESLRPTRRHGRIPRSA